VGGKMMIQGKILSYGNDLSDIYRIREKVFLEELSYRPEVLLDEQDVMSLHVIVYEEAESKRPVATGRLTFDGTSCELDNLAVLKEFRNRKYGDFAVRMLLNKAFIAGIVKVTCIVPIETALFFETIGFHTTGSEMIINNQRCFRMQIIDTEIIKECNKSL
jgi:ribosomal protein S18 acetylase RimI-like enzyme